MRPPHPNHLHSQSARCRHEGAYPRLQRAGVRACVCARGTSRRLGSLVGAVCGIKASRSATGEPHKPKRAANGIMHPGAPLILSPLTTVGLCGLRVSQTSPPAAFGGMGLGRGSRTGEPKSEAARTADRCARAWPGVKRCIYYFIRHRMKPALRAAY